MTHRPPGLILFVLGQRMAEAAIPNVKSGATRRVRGVASASRGGWLAAAALLFVGFTVAAFLQPRHPDAAKVREPFSREWWLYPREASAAKQWLPRVEADLNGIYAVEGVASGREQIWAVGNLGLILHSADGGKSWTKQTLPAPVPESAPAAPIQTPNPPPIRRPDQTSQVTVPSVINQRIEIASKTIERLGLRVDVQFIELLDRRPPGSVIDQKPASGAQAAVGETVTLMVKRDPPQMQQTAPGNFEQNKAPESQPVDPSQYPPPQEQRRGEAAKDDDAAAWWPTLTGVVYAQSNAGAPPQAQAGASNGGGQTAESQLEDLVTVFGPSERVRIAISRSNRPYFSVDGDAWARLDSDTALDGRQGLTVKLQRGWLDRPGGSESWGAASPQSIFMWFTGADAGLVTVQGMFETDGEPVVAVEIPTDRMRHLATDNDGGDEGSIAWGLKTDGTIGVYRSVGEPGVPFTLSNPSTFRWFWIAPRGSSASSQVLPPAWFVGEGGALRRMNLPDADPGQVQTVRVADGVAEPFDVRVETVATGTTVNLNSVCFLPDNRTGWIAGDRGTILRSDDGGKTWTHQTQGILAEAPGEYERSLPPWYFLSWLLVGLVLAPAFRKEKPQEIESESVADLLVSDRPLQLGDPDPMQLHAIAEGLSRFMRNENTEPPLTIAVTGKWGTGKSSLMNLLQSSLLGYRMRPVWFNAWHHQKDQHLLASLVQNIRLQSVPPWWHPQGWIFGGRLFLSRDWRTWLPVGLLVAFLAFLGGFFHQMAHESESFTVTDVADLFAGLVKLIGGELPEGTTAGQKGTLALTLLGTIASLYASYRKLLAFGVNPATLLAGQSGSAGMGALEAQTGFRKRFADQFAEVTNALGADRLVIFIDDLDRCQPDSVVEVLEAVNFLVSSGRCFIVLGMDSRYVERCVGLSFTKVAEEMVDDVEADERGKLRTLDAKQKRQDFAHNYLQKLINIEVPLPAPTPAQVSQLLTGGKDEAGDTPPQRRINWVPALSWAGRIAVICIGLFATYQAFELGSDTSWLAARKEAETPAIGGATSSPGGPSAEGQPPVSPSSGDLPGSSVPPEAEEERGQPEAIGHPGQRAEIVMPEEKTGLARWLGHWPVVFVLLILVAAAYWVLTRRPDLVVRDSPEFVEALHIWQPAVVARQNTPRAVKRFLNRVRYFAMRQRAPAPEMTLGQRVRSNIARFLGVAGANPPPLEAEGGIPEHALVALAAIAEYREGISLSPLAGVEKSDGVLAEVLARHRQRFDASEIERQAGAFVTMAGGIDVR